jgi:hypothetical protein
MYIDEMVLSKLVLRRGSLPVVSAAISGTERGKKRPPLITDAPYLESDPKRRDITMNRFALIISGCLWGYNVNVAL